MIKTIDITPKELEEMKQRSNTGSKLLPYKDQIIFMCKSEINNAEISRWLSKRGVKTTNENIRQFCKRYEKDYVDVEFEYIDINDSVYGLDKKDIERDLRHADLYN